MKDETKPMPLPDPRKGDKDRAKVVREHQKTHEDAIKRNRADERLGQGKPVAK